MCGARFALTLDGACGFCISHIMGANLGVPPVVLVTVTLHPPIVTPAGAAEHPRIRVLVTWPRRTIVVSRCDNQLVGTTWGRCGFSEVDDAQRRILNERRIRPGACCGPLPCEGQVPASTSDCIAGCANCRCMQRLEASTFRVSRARPQLANGSPIRQRKSREVTTSLYL